MTKNKLKKAPASGPPVGAAATPRAGLSDVYWPRRGTDGFYDIPHSIYFYYVGPEYTNDEGELTRDVKHYFDVDADRPIFPDEVEFRVADLAENARRHPSRQYPPPHGQDFQYVVWDCKSYIVFLIDDDVELEKYDAIAFTPIMIGGGENHSFFDAWDMDIEVAGETRPAVGCVNYMKKDFDGNDLGRAKQVFQPTLTLKGGTRLFGRTWPDSGGTNMGPPIPPP